jgi:EmrB/QacA subfamily drug resistance transporter
MKANRENQKHPACFFMVATGVFLSTMDSSMQNIALPFIMKSFASTLAEAEWVVLIYLLTITVSLLFWGIISDIFGKSKTYLYGMLIFSVACLCSYFAPSLSVLILFRSFQGIGAAMMMATGPAIIRQVMPREQLGKWLGLLGIATSIGLMSGPLIGGFVLHHYGWRTLFLVNVPVSVPVFLVGWFYLSGVRPSKVQGNRSSLDITGAILWAAVISLLILLLSGHLELTISGLFLMCVILCGMTMGLYLFERTQKEPFLPIALLQRRYYATAMFSVMLSFVVLFFVLILMPLYLHYVAELSSDKIGYMMMAVPVTLFIVSPLSGILFDKMGARYLTFGGLFITGSAVLLLSAITENSSSADIAWRLALLGCGQSIFLSPNTASVLSRVSLEDTGVSAAMLATSRNLGMVIGVATAGLIFSFLFQEYSGGGNLREYTVAQLPSFIRSFRYTLYFAAALAFLGSFISLQRP